MKIISQTEWTKFLETVHDNKTSKTKVTVKTIKSKPTEESVLTVEKLLILHQGLLTLGFKEAEIMAVLGKVAVDVIRTD